MWVRFLITLICFELNFKKIENNFLLFNIIHKKKKKLDIYQEIKMLILSSRLIL